MTNEEKQLMQIHLAKVELIKLGIKQKFLSNTREPEVSIIARTPGIDPWAFTFYATRENLVSYLAGYVEPWSDLTATWKDGTAVNLAVVGGKLAEL